MRILYVSCGYLPDNIGGTEVYVHGLSRELASRGHQVFISYVSEFYEKGGPKMRVKEYVFDGAPIYVVEKNTFGLKTSRLYFDPEYEIYPLFKDYLKRIEPDVIHFHHFSSTDAISQMKSAKDMGVPVIFTYHTPAMTCGHSDMLFMGRNSCDGKIGYNRCLTCMQTKYKVPFPLAWLWSHLPYGIAGSLGRFVSGAGFKSFFATWLQLPWLTRERMARWESGFKMIDHFVAVCQWVYDILLNNNIPPQKLTLCRQGIGRIPQVIKKQKNENLRLGYLGRIHPVKGIDVLLEAFKTIPSHYQIELFIYGYAQNKADEKYHHKLRRQSRKDKRIKWLGRLEETDTFQALSDLDMLVIPSRWLETGPLVLLEAWAVGTPVIGTRYGGILELVTDGVNGLLFPCENARELAGKITSVYSEPGLIDRLRSGIPKVRTMGEVADDAEHLYKEFIR